MKFTERYARLFQYLLPTPFTIALLLTMVTFALALFLTKGESQAYGEYALVLLKNWEAGLWEEGLMVFAMQMMLILVLGHVLALSKPVDRLISFLVGRIRSNAEAAMWVCLVTILVALFNWGLGLIFGAIFARKVAEKASRINLPIHYPLIGAAGYIGLMVWHGGLSGSSLAKVAESGHLKKLMQGIYSTDQLQALPEQITFSETVFSNMNLYSTLMLLILLPALFYFLGKRTPLSQVELEKSAFETESKSSNSLSGAEKLDHSKWFAYALGGVILFYAFYKAVMDQDTDGLGFITPNYINFFLLGLGIVFHQNFNSFLMAVDEAIGGAAGILIQFPLYFGIMGLMKSSGMVVMLSDTFVQISNADTFPILSLFSAGIVNVFVPSGGGQWAVQGPIIVQASQSLGIPLSKGIMALAYGDQLTNMLQPFWALPLLGITGLKAKEILPFTLIAMILGLLIFISALILF